MFPLLYLALYWLPNSSVLLLHFCKFPCSSIFTLYTHLLPITVLFSGNSVRIHVPFCFSDSISSSMAIRHCSACLPDTASLYDLGPRSSVVALFITSTNLSGGFPLVLRSDRLVFSSGSVISKFWSVISLLFQDDFQLECKLHLLHLLLTTDLQLGHHHTVFLLMNVNHVPEKLHLCLLVFCSY